MPLQGAVVGFCSEAAGGVVQPVANGCKEKSSQNTSSDLANVPRFRIGKFEVWFGYDSGMIRGMIRKPIFFEFRKLCCLSLSFPPSTYYDCYLMAAMARPARRPRSKCTSMIYIRRPASWMFFSCTFSSATLRLLFLFDGFLVWLPASQPATAGVIPLISNTSSQPRSQPAATSQPYSQPPNQKQQLSQPPSQPASHPEPASLGIMMRLCARGEDSSLREGMWR